MIAVIDYGVGNVQAFLTMYKRLGIEAIGASTPSDLAAASHLILPGVGAFDEAMIRFEASGLRAPTERRVLAGTPLLGVCVGMQMLANRSDEGEVEGLGWIKGRVRSFVSLEGASTQPRPHMGWNDVVPRSESNLFVGLREDARFYFLHSFYFECESAPDILAHCEYGANFACAVGSANVMGVQFHPEKSHHWGAKLLQNFAALQF